MHLLKKTLSFVGLIATATLVAFGAAVDLDGNAVTNKTALWDIDMSKTTVGDVGDVIAPDYASISNAAINAAYTNALQDATISALVSLTNNWSDTGGVKTNAFSALPPFNFETMQGMYLAVSNLVYALGGTVTNFPAIPVQ